MPYEAKIVSVEGRFGTVDLRVEYKNGVDVITKDYNLHDPTQLDKTTLQAFIRGEIDTLNKFVDQVADIKATMVGVKITGTPAVPK